jgi:hypothetical protein
MQVAFSWAAPATNTPIGRTKGVVTQPPVGGPSLVVRSTAP